ncbi:MAG: hypothetical protein P8I38_08530 [Arenicella sp.]|jgi:hypothetical protein|nr:hypothetical protein [Arenicella sp.]HAU69144.1 hypothetical protein [Gammaproteobacteria bacterium]
MTKTTKNQTHETTVELVHLKNGDIALRRADSPEQPMVVIRFSDSSLSLVAPDKMDIARAMVEAGIQRFGDIQSQRVEEAKEAAEQGMLH